MGVEGVSRPFKYTLFLGAKSPLELASNSKSLSGQKVSKLQDLASYVSYDQF